MIRVNGKLITIEKAVKLAFNNVGMNSAFVRASVNSSTFTVKHIRD